MSFRLLIVTAHATTVHHFLLPYGEFFRRLGWRVDTAASHTADYPSLTETFDEVHEIGWSRSPFAVVNVIGFRDIRRLMRTERYDIVHVHTPVAAFITRIALIGLPADERPIVVYTAHGFRFHKNDRGISSTTFRLAERVVGPLTDGLIVMNREDRDVASRLGLVPEGRVFFMPGIGIDTSAWLRENVSSANGETARAEAGIPVGVPVVVTVGELNSRKRHRDLIAAVAGARDTRFHAILIGGGPREARLRQQSVELGIEDRVHFLGYREDVGAILADSALMVLPSEREGLPRSVIEAMCMGVPVVAADVRGSRDLLEGGAGVLYPMGDVEALSEAIDRVLSDPGLAEELSLEATSRIERYDLSTLFDQHRLVYETLVTEIGT